MDGINKFILVIWILFFIYLIAYFISKKYKKSKKDYGTSKNAKIINKIYDYLIKLPIIKKDLREVKSRLYANKLWDDETLFFKATTYYILSWLAALIAFIFVCIYYKDNPFQIFVLSIFCYYLKIIVLDKLIGDDTYLLEGLIEFNEDLIQDYHLHNDVDKAVEQAKNENSNYLVVRHIENIRDAIDSEEDLQLYVDECSNEYLKLMVLNCNLTKEYGDSLIKDDESSFVENTRYFNKLISMVLFKRRQLRYKLRSAALQCIVPLLFFNPFDWWVDNYIPDLNVFFESSWGYILKIVLTICLVIFFIVVRNLSMTEANLIKVKKYFWEDKILKVKPIGFIINKLTPKVNSKKFYYYRSLISKSQLQTKINWITLHKVLIAFTAFIFSICLAATVHKINYANIYDDNSLAFSGEIITINGQQVKTNEMEKQLVNSIKNKNLDEKSKISSLENALISNGVSNEDSVKLAQKVASKIDELNNEYIKWYEILICIVFSVICTQIPLVYLKLKAKTSTYNMQSEVMIFETIVLILMNFENTTIELMLDYFSKFAFIFKNSIDQAIFKLQKGTEEALSGVINDKSYETEFQTNQEDALNELIEKVDFKPFKNLIKNLIKAEDISIDQAFLNLSTNRNQYAKDRESEDEKVVIKRVSICKTLALISTMLVIFGYIVGPFMLVTNYKMNSLMNDFSTEDQSK